MGILPNENQPLASWRSQVASDPTHVLWAVAAVDCEGRTVCRAGQIVTKTTSQGAVNHQVRYG